MIEPGRRRRRPTTSCSVCRRRKTRCNRQTPCSNCVRSRKKEVCVYDQEPQPACPRPHSIQPSPGHGHASSLPTPRTALPAQSTASTSSTCGDPPGSLVGGTPSPETNATQVSAPNIDLMQSRIRHLEEQLSKATPKPSQTAATTPTTGIVTTSSKFAGTFHVHGGNTTSTLFGRSALMSRCISHKTRLLGQSHWMNGAVPITKSFVAIIEPHLREGHHQVLDIAEKCKNLGRLLKSQRAPPWPCPPTRDLPPKHLADCLVARYLDTIETVYRVLHIPAFKRDYEAVWAKPDAQPETSFLVQLKLVLALGAVTYDSDFSLRTEAIRWIYEAQTYLSEPVFKSRLRIHTVQTRVLLILAMELVDVSGDSIWISAGSLIRTAITMGLHRDPRHLPEMTSLAAEMRRRLWNTILEISLQASISKGGPPLLSLADFDSEVPGNIDDEVLTTGPNQVPNDSNEPTIMSVPRALRATYPIRLKVTKFLNDLNTSGGTYEETIQLDNQFREAFKELRRGLHPLRDAPSTRFAAQAAELIMNRYFSSLHMPYFAASLESPAYAFSRQAILDTLLKIWCAAWPSSSIAGTAASPPNAYPATSPGNSVSSEELLARLITCATGFFRTAAVQVSFTIPMELHAQLQDDEGLGPTRLRRDLAAVAGEIKAWSWRCIEAGETSVKGYLMSSLLVAQTEALQRWGPKAVDDDELARFLIGEGEKAAEKCVPLMEAMVEGTKRHGAPAVVDEFGPSPGLTEEWDFTRMTNAMFAPEGQGAMSWFESDSMPGLYFW